MISLSKIICSYDSILLKRTVSFINITNSLFTHRIKHWFLRRTFFVSKSVFVIDLMVNKKHKSTLDWSTPIQMSHKVFVYGTLKRNEPNHYWLTNLDNGMGKFISEGTTKQKYPLIIATKYNIPFLLQSPGNGHFVKGEIYEVDDKMLSNLDILEGHPDYYVREIDDIYVTKGQIKEIEKCWVYFLKTFRPELLSKEQFQNYSSKGSHGLEYLERSKRDPNYNYYPEIKG